MADFTTDEIQAAVEQLVQSTVATPYDTLGTRRPDVAFQGVQQAVAGIFILYPLAPFYCTYLGAQRLVEAITSEVQVVESLLESVGSLGRLVLPVEDLSPLFNAQAALQALGTAVASGAPADITKLPQYQRYASNVSSFLAGPASAIKQNGSIVPTPQEARASIPSLVSQLQVAHAGTVQAAKYLSMSMADFASVNLSALVAQGIISNAAKVLSADTSTLSGLSASDRLSALRTPILNLIAARSTVTAFGSFSGPSAFYTVTGTGFPYSDATHLATPAELLATKGPPYNVVPGVNDTLAVTLDGSATPVTVKLPSSLFVTLAGTVVEAAPTADEGGSVDGYLIGNGVHPTGLLSTPIPNNNQLHFKITSVGGPTADVTAVLTPSNDGPAIQRRTAQQVSNDINTALTGIGITQLIAEPYFYPSVHYQGAMSITPTTGSLAQFDLPTPISSTLAACVVGDQILITAGLNVGQWFVTSIPSTSQLIASKVSGAPALEASASLVIGPKDQAVRFRCVDAVTVDQLWTITMYGDTPAALNTATTLGLAPGYSVTCAPNQPSDIISYVNQQQKKFTVDSVVVSGLSTPITTDPINPFHVIASKFLGTATLAFAAGVITLSGTVGLLAAGVGVGDTVVLRGQNNTTWIVSSVSDTGLTATGVTATPGTGIAFEVGPTFPFARWQTMQITTGPNRGNYLIDSVGVSPIDILLRQRTSIPHYQEQTTFQPVSQSAIVGIELLTFSSPTQTTASSVAVTGTGVPLFWTTPPSVATGSSPYFFLPKPTAGGLPVAGDLLEFFAANYATPSQICTITTVDVVTGGLVIGVTPDVPDLPATWAFGSLPPPFASLKHGHVVDFIDFKTALDAWLALPTQQTTLFFQSLNRVINPLLANTNPTAADVGSAVQTVNQLAVLLDEADAVLQGADPSLTLEAILKAYLVDPVSQVDTLVKTYRAQGADRAIDLLLGGQFSTFFGLSQDGTSYAGQMQASMRAVAQNDLPVRKANRSTSVQARQLAATESPDFEFDTSDAESGLKPDAPADFEKTGGNP